MQKLESFGITQQEMFSAVSNNNQLIAAGLIDTGHGSFAVKVPGVIEKPEDLLHLPIRSTGNATITLSDVAQVRRTFYDPTTYASDGSGRQIRAKDATGTINRATYDSIGRSSAQYIGTNDNGDAGGDVFGLVRSGGHGDTSS